MVQGNFDNIQGIMSVCYYCICPPIDIRRPAFIFAWIDLFAIGYFIEDVAQVGIYSAAVPIATLMAINIDQSRKFDTSGNNGLILALSDINSV